jgi:hypothetical protein
MADGAALDVVEDAVAVPVRAADGARREAGLGLHARGAEAVVAVELGLLLRPQPIARLHAGRALYERTVVRHPDLVAVLDRVAQRDEAHARADVGRVEQPPSWLVDLCVVIDVDDRTDLGSAAIQYDAALPPSRDVECRHRVPPFHCFAAGRRRQVAIAARMLPG